MPIRFTVGTGYGSGKTGICHSEAKPKNLFTLNPDGTNFSRVYATARSFATEAQDDESGGKILRRDAQDDGSGAKILRNTHPFHGGYRLRLRMTGIKNDNTLLVIPQKRNNFEKS